MSVCDGCAYYDEDCYDIVGLCGTGEKYKPKEQDKSIKEVK